MDEPGLMVTGIEKDGSLKFTRVGETDRRTIPGRRVKVGPDGIPGVIGGKAVHHAAASERDKPAEPDKLRIDIGAANEEEAKALVHLGDTAAFQAEFERLGLHRLKGKALSSGRGARCSSPSSGNLSLATPSSPSPSCGKRGRAAVRWSPPGCSPAGR